MRQGQRKAQCQRGRDQRNGQADPPGHPKAGWQAKRQPGQPLEQDGQQRQGNEQSSHDKGKAIQNPGHAAGIPVLHRRAEAAAKICRLAKMEGQRSGGKADHQLHHCQLCCARKVKLKAQCLIDRQFYRAGFWPAAQRQHHGKAGHGEHEHQQQGRGCSAAQDRHFNKHKSCARCQAKLGGKAEMLGWHRLPTLQQHPRGQRQVEKHMRQQHPFQPVNIQRPKPRNRQRIAKNPRAPPDRQQPKYRHDRGQ